MDKKTLESKIKRSVQVLLYLFEVKTKIKKDDTHSLELGATKNAILEFAE